MVRAAILEDWPEIERLLRSIGFTDGQTPDQLRARLSEAIARPEHILCVAEQDGLVGYAWAQDFGPHLRSGQSTAKLHDLWVDEPLRGHGVGRDLFAAVRAWAIERRVRWLQWYAGTSATGFYSALGTEPIPTHDAVHPFYELDLG